MLYFDPWISFRRHFFCINVMWKFLYLVFLTWAVPVFLFGYCIITLWICCLLLNLSFDVLPVICRLQNIRSRFEIPFYLVPPFVFLFRAHAFFNMVNIFRFSRNGTTVPHWRFHVNCFMTTSAVASKFQKKKNSEKHPSRRHN
jgi:hypothetical protein